MLQELPALSKNAADEGGTIEALGHLDATGLETIDGNPVATQVASVAYQTPQAEFCWYISPLKYKSKMTF
jgi:hypothetical protein